MNDLVSPASIARELNTKIGCIKAVRLATGCDLTTALAAVQNNTLHVQSNDTCTTCDQCRNVSGRLEALEARLAGFLELLK